MARAPSIAELFCGDTVRLETQSRIWRPNVPARIPRIADGGGITVVQLPEPGRQLSDDLHKAIAVPSLVDIHVDLPNDTATLRDQLKTSTTREDFRRIRKAGFTFRVATDPDALNEFHTRHYTPLIEQQFPEDGRIASAQDLVVSLGQGGELVCADIDDEWVAGIHNVATEAGYALGGLGIRDADNSVRQKRVVAALIIRSLERAVELGHHRATLGRSLPFLGKGPVWFKVKWGGVITRRTDVEDMHMFLDLRLTAVRAMLANSPVIHNVGDSLVASAWLVPGEKPLQDLVRDSARFPGITAWYVLGSPETIAVAEEQLSAHEYMVPIAVAPGGDRPVWLGDVLSDSNTLG